MLIICNDMALLLVSYWLAFAFSYGWDITLQLPLPLKIKMIIGALAVIPASYIAPPVFLRRIIYGDHIISRTAQTVIFQSLIVYAKGGLEFQF